MKEAAMTLTRRPMPSRDARNRRWRRRCSAIVAVVTLCSALLAAPALAGKPDRVRLPPREPFVDPPGVQCPVAIAPEGVGVAYAGGNAVERTFDNGRVLTTGRASDRVTNVATGKSVVLDLHGSVASVPQPDGSVEQRLSGTHSFVFFAGDVGPGDDAIGRSYVFTGNVRLVFGANGSVIAFESAGKMEDVCAMIA
jgi:hypothetical protein